MSPPYHITYHGGDRLKGKAKSQIWEPRRSYGLRRDKTIAIANLATISTTDVKMSLILLIPLANGITTSPAEVWASNQPPDACELA
eukprot:3317918-Pleurochrysis_carterae.AAC.1